MDFEEIKIEVLKAYTRALKYLSYRPRSEKEIRDRLAKKHFDSMIIDQVIDKLKEDKFLDDTGFAQWWTEQRQDFRGKSKFVIKSELSEKGIDRNTIDATLTNAKDDLKTAKEFLDRKKRRFENYTGDEYKKKVIGFLQRKGFSWDVIQKVLKDEN
ncbi:MAG TPA: regulatory protein RecX [Candidatus Levybacteria bacterium]|nr:regulatory protein RecX [Candidatus Levybacteria bacterium]